MSRPVLVALLASLAACSSPTDPPPTTTPGKPGPAKLAVAASVSAPDFEVSAPGGASAAVASDGTFQPPAATAAGLLVATPRAGTPSGANAGALYLSPTTGTEHLVGPPYALATTGAPVVDAKTTVMGLALLHPSAAHPDPARARHLLGWMATRAAGWGALGEAAAAWDRAIAAGKAPADQADFKAAFTQVVAELGALPAFEEPGETGQPLTAPLLAAKAGVVVSDVQLVESGAGSQRVKAVTKAGTALDHLYVVRQITTDAAMPWVLDPAFAFPSTTSVVAAKEIGRGMIAASSYASYLDVVGNTIRLVTSALASPLAPAQGELLPGEQTLFEIRFFSGGFGGDPAVAAFQREHFKVEGMSALVQNLSMGMIEALKLIPGSETALEQEGTADVIQEGVTQLGQGAATLLATKEWSQITSDDLYALAFDTAKAVVDKLLEMASQKPQEGAWKRLVQFVGHGGSAAVKTVLSIPGKVATGGALANRAVRLAAPESLMEVWVVAVDTREVTTVEKVIRLESSAHPVVAIDCRVALTGHHVVPIGHATPMFIVSSTQASQLAISCNLASDTHEHSWVENGEGGATYTYVLESAALRVEQDGPCVLAPVTATDRWSSALPFDGAGCTQVSVRAFIEVPARTEVRNEAGELVRTDDGGRITLGLVEAFVGSRANL